MAQVSCTWQHLSSGTGTGLQMGGFQGSWLQAALPSTAGQTFLSTRNLGCLKLCPSSLLPVKARGSLQGTVQALTAQSPSLDRNFRKREAGTEEPSQASGGDGASQRLEGAVLQEACGHLEPLILFQTLANMLNLETGLYICPC